MGNRDLKPCPFCGMTANEDGKPIRLTAVHIQTEKHHKVYGMECEPFIVVYVKCGRCMARGGESSTVRSVTGHKNTVEEAEANAVRNWNKRPA